MDRNQGTGGIPPENDHSTYDEAEHMDRAAQAGVEGAFGAAPDAEQTLEQMREDAEDVFGDQNASGESTGAAGSGSAGGTPTTAGSIRSNTTGLSETGPFGGSTSRTGGLSSGGSMGGGARSGPLGEGQNRGVSPLDSDLDPTEDRPRE